MIRALLLCCLLAFPALAKKPAKPPGQPPPPACPTAFGWSCPTTVQGVTGNYTPVVQMGGAQIRVYGNTNGAMDGNLYLRVGSWSAVGSASTVLDIANARDTYIRTSAVAVGASGIYYAMLYTGDGYPTQGGYSPSWATSSDGYAWTWHGPITIFGRNQSSAAALIVDETKADDYACMAWIDIGATLRLMHAALPCMPADWRSDGLNQWPVAGEVPQFVTAAQTPYGVHLMGAIGFPATALRHVFSCTGLSPLRVIEQASDVINTSAGKGTNLVYDAATNTLHALTSGVHWTLPARSFPC